ncbi:N-methylhydantoinase A [Salipiger profundus]|nr:N-methylhydantoinase A [Salipiger profundus]
MIADLARTGAEAVGICFLHSYANHVHENCVAEEIRAALPEMFVSTSSDVVNEFREYERFSSTVLNASLLPVMDQYLSDFEEGVRKLKPEIALRVMQSNGGVMSSGMARRKPINTFLSGPAAGVVGAVEASTRAGSPDFITFDMGGTSTDVCLIDQGNPTLRQEQIIAGLPVKRPTVDVNTVGSGGGSIAWLDEMGLLKVGPRSAGAYPGPACYGRGGKEPTVSDANMYLGRLNPNSLLGGRMKVDQTAAETALGKLAAPMTICEEEAAAGILKIVTADMVQAIRVISVERGMDPRNYALVAYGGAGPLHAADVALELGMSRVIVPQSPGLLCALGLLHSKLRIDFSQTRLITMEEGAEIAMNELLAGLQADFECWKRSEGVADQPMKTSLSGDFRYHGQDFELSIPLSGSQVTAIDTQRLVEAFHNAHLEQYGYNAPAQQVQLVAMRLVVSGDKPELPAYRASQGERVAVPSEARNVWFETSGWIETPVYLREMLPTGTKLDGPAVVEQMDTITVVPPEMTLSVLPDGALMLESKV